jgi:hypothetical protein
MKIVAKKPEPAFRIERPSIIETELLMVLLAELALVARARAELPADQVEHPGIRAALTGLYLLHDAGRTPAVDNLRDLLDEFTWGACTHFAARGRKLLASVRIHKTDCLEKVLKRFRYRPREREISRLIDNAKNPQEARALLRQLREDAPEVVQQPATGEDLQRAA